MPDGGRLVGLGGDRPVHPSAWCKSTQGWINVVSQTSNADVTISDIKTGHTAYRLWKDGLSGNEYFLVENRQQTGFDASLPGQGLLIWHIDEAIPDNTNENHYKVALMQADGVRQLESNANRDDTGDPYPGSTGNVSFTGSSNPNSRSHAGSNTFVAVTGIPASSPAMQVHLSVSAMAAPPTLTSSRPKTTMGTVVNVEENRARVQLQPLTLLAPGPSEGWHVCQVMVDASDPVEGYPNLLGSDLPRALEAMIPAAVVDELGSAPRWQVEASLVAPGRLRVERIAT